MITRQILNDTASFNHLRQEWTELLQASPCNGLFLTWEWMYTWWLYLAADRTLNIITVRRDGALIAIAPFVRCPARFKRLMPFRVLEFLASGSVGSDYLSIIIRPGHEEDALREIAESLTASGLMLELARVEKTSLLMVNVALQLRRFGWQSINLTTNYCPYIDLSGHTWESYLGSLHRGHRSTVNYKLNKLYRKFKVDFQQVESESQRQVAMDIFVKLHLARWAGQGGSTALYSEELVNFHQNFSRILLDRGWLRLYTLLLDGVPAASIYIFKYGNIFYYYQMACNTDYGKYSVGMIILALAIKSAIAEGVVEFDLLHDDEEYKYLWAREERELMRLDLYPPQNMGRLYKQAALVKNGVKQLARHWQTHH